MKRVITVSIDKSLYRQIRELYSKENMKNLKEKNSLISFSKFVNDLLKVAVELKKEKLI